MVTIADNIVLFNINDFCRIRSISVHNICCSVDRGEAVSMIWEHCVGSSVMIFSDGSVCGGSVGCGACAAVLFPVSQTDPVQIDTFAVGSRVSSLDCETEGVILGIKMAIKYFEAFQNLHTVPDVFIFFRLLCCNREYCWNEI